MNVRSDRYCPRVYDYMVLLREPVDRLLTRPAPRPAVVRALKAALAPPPRRLAPPPRPPPKEKNETLAALRDDAAALNIFDNYYTRSLCADTAVYDAAFGSVDEAAFLAARAMLQKFTFVTTLDLVTAYPDAAARVMSNSPLGWRNFSSGKVNRMPANLNATATVLDAAEVASLTALNAPDRRLWAYADRRTRREAGLEGGGGSGRRAAVASRA